VLSSLPFLSIAGNDQDESDFDRVSTGNGIVYSFLRPYTDSNGLTVVNFSNSSQIVTLNLTNTNLKFTGGFDTGNTYWVNDLYNGTSSQVMGSDLASFQVNLSAYGSAIYTISTVEEMVDLPPLPPIVSVEDELASTPDNYYLEQNFPNPFNPSTKIKYSLPDVGLVSLKVYDVLGNEIAALVNEEKPAGNYEVHFNASSLASGIYFYTLQAGTFIETKKMILLK
jgi:hypothetical protein